MEPPVIPHGSNVMGVGIDQIEVSRIHDSLAQHGDHFITKVFSSEEQAYCQDKADSAPFFAARFAAKEATAKALGTGLDAEVRHGKAGEPILHFSDRGLKLLESKGANQALISLTHLESVASAIVILICI